MEAITRAFNADVNTNSWHEKLMDDNWVGLALLTNLLLMQAGLLSERLGMVLN